MLSCSASGHPAINVVWQFNGRPIQSDGSHKIHITRHVRNEVSTSLTISSIKLEHSGLYSCVFEYDNQNEITKLIHSNRVNVVGQIFARDGRLIGKESTNVTLDCLYGGYPFSSISWKKGEFDGIFFPYFAYFNFLFQSS